MRIEWAAALAVLPAVLSAQERVSVKGRIVNERGESIEYVQLGIPKLQTGTISSADGRFEIEVSCDTLDIFLGLPVFGNISSYLCSRNT